MRAVVVRLLSGELGQLAVVLEPLDLDFAVKVTDVADDGIDPHHHEVLASGDDEDVAPLGAFLHGGHLVALHGGLQGIDGVHLGDDDPASEAPQGLGAILAVGHGSSCMVLGGEDAAGRPGDLGLELEEGLDGGVLGR